MQEGNDLFRQCFLCLSEMRLGFHLFLQCVDFLLAQEGQLLQVINYLFILGIYEELIHFIRTCFMFIQPYRTGLTLSKFRTVSLGNQRHRQSIALHIRTMLLANQLQTACDISPLILSAKLQCTPLILIQM